MPDYDSSLPVRTEADGTDERMHAKIVDYSDPGGSDKQVQVSDKNMHVEVHGNRADDAADVVMLLSETGRVNPDGIYEVDNNSLPANIGLIAHERNDTPTDAHQTLRVTAKANAAGDVRALDVALHDENGEAYSPSNPFPVAISDTESGTKVHDYNESASVAKDASVSVDYTVTALKTLHLARVLLCGSGKIKAVLQRETGVGADTYDTFAVRFNSTSQPNCDIDLGTKLEVDAGVKVRLILTNLDNQPQNIYSTLIGVEV